jgi:hypothetical protein
MFASVVDKSEPFDGCCKTRNAEAPNFALACARQTSQGLLIGAYQRSVTHLAEIVGVRIAAVGNSLLRVLNLGRTLWTHSVPARRLGNAPGPAGCGRFVAYHLISS